MYTRISLVVLASMVAAVIANPSTRRQAAMAPASDPNGKILAPPGAFRAPGVATFNNYAAQHVSVCFPSGIPIEIAQQQPFGAAAGDISPDVGLAAAGGQTCAGSNLGADQQAQANYPANPDGSSRCNGFKPASFSDGPACTQLFPQCPASTGTGREDTCYKVTSYGYIGGSTQAFTPGSTIVKVIDSCPAGHPQNFCKGTSVPNLFEKCQDPGVNSLDLDGAAYQALTGVTYVYDSGMPNVSIYIEPTPCP